MDLVTQKLDNKTIILLGRLTTYAIMITMCLHRRPGHGDKERLLQQSENEHHTVQASLLSHPIHGVPPGHHLRRQETSDVHGKRAQEYQ